jgi:hypothetical protein
MILFLQVCCAATRDTRTFEARLVGQDPQGSPRLWMFSGPCESEDQTRNERVEGRLR